ncbi:MAG: site-2 protease family protein [Syntrophobacterales bacterium]|jgi:membrane-associated protease RseP (regulator of RpoE activity)|nr:site-2 protease family protein [Syntrophobacterales bacterium]
MVKIILFILTIASTYFVQGLAYSIPLMTILLSHEMGHYFMSRHYGMPATLPYFIPFPLSPFGTLGAIIKVKGSITNKRALFDIGAAGPLAGFIAAVPFAMLGIKWSTIQIVAPDAPFVRLGDPLIFQILQHLIVGEIPTGYDLVLHPIGYAGWVGFFITALNLLPVGQLDGGHVLYAVFGEKSKWIFITVVIALGLTAIFYNPGWLLLVILLIIFGRRHPQPADMETELDSQRKALAFVILLIFLLSFTPAPFPQLNFNLPESKGIPI